MFIVNFRKNLGFGFIFFFGQKQRFRLPLNFKVYIVHIEIFDASVVVGLSGQSRHRLIRCLD